MGHFLLWLKLILGWPASIFDWDVLFLIPVPWIGPVVAPVLVSIAMIAGGLLIVRQEEQSGLFRASKRAICLSLIGSAAVLCSFLLDVDASLRFQYPSPYHYELLVLGLVCYGGAFTLTARRSTAS